MTMRRNGQTGGASTLLMICIVLLAMFAAGALTIGRLATKKQDVQHAADSIALGAAYMIQNNGMPVSVAGFNPVNAYGQLNTSSALMVSWVPGQADQAGFTWVEADIQTAQSFLPTSSWFPPLIRPIRATAKARISQQVFDTAMERRPKLVLVLDFSGSMADRFWADPSKVKINVLKQAVSQLLAADLDVEYGSAFFDSNVFFSSNVGYNASHPEIQGALNRYGPGSSTNTGAAIARGTQLLSVGEDTGRYMLIVTDGEPTAGAGDPYTYAENAAVQAWGTDVTIFTAWIPDASQASGNTRQRQFMQWISGDAVNQHNPANFFQINTANQLIATFQAIVASILCQIGPLQPAPSDPASIHVALHAPSGTETALPQVANLGQAGQPAFIYDAAQARVRLSAQACDLINNQGYKAIVRYDKPTLTF
jgi:hypothetical protein